MVSLPLSIQEARSFLEQNQTAASTIRSLLEHQISTKSLSFRKTDFQESYDKLFAFEGLLVDLDTNFRPNFENLIILEAVGNIAEKALNEPIPGEPIACLEFGKKFGEYIRQPKLNHHWNSNLELNSESYLLIYLNQEKGVNITEFVKSVTKEMEDQYIHVRGVDLLYTHAYPYLRDTIEVMYATARELLDAERTSDSGGNMLQNIGRINPLKAEQLYRYAKKACGETNQKILSRLIVGLFPRNESQYLSEAIELFQIDPLQGLLTLTWLEYTDVTVLKKAVAYIESQKIEEIDYLRNAPTFYIRLIENKHSPEDVINACFSKIRLFTKYEDQTLRNNLVWRTGMLKNRDKEKFDLLPDFMAWETPHFLRNYFDHFTSPRDLFILIRHAFLQHGMNVDMQLLGQPLDSQYMLHRPAFEKELALLLSDDIAILRYGGLQVISSHYGGLFTFDSSELSEDRQGRVIETLLSSPVNIEEILPLVLPFRNSPFPAIAEKLKDELIALIPAYEKHLVDMLLPKLDQSVKKDQELAEAVRTAYAMYSTELEAKTTIKEFDPFENEWTQLDAFYRLEREIQAENIEKAQSGSVFAQIARQVTIIRGSGWNSESQQEISMLQTFGVSRLMDRRYYTNPDKFEWRFRMNAIGKNYSNPAK